MGKMGALENSPWLVDKMMIDDTGGTQDNPPTLHGGVSPEHHCIYGGVSDNNAGQLTVAAPSQK